MPNESYKVIIGDAHLGSGHYLPDGKVNPLESFTKDGQFIELLSVYDAAKIDATEIELVINGDFLDLLQVRLDKDPPDTITLDYTIKQLEVIRKGHLLLFEALREWLGNPRHKLRYVVGNHDQGMAFHEALEYFYSDMCNSSVPTDVVKDPFRYIKDNFHIEHGHQGEILWAVDEEIDDNIIDPPWGFYWCTALLNQVRRECPYLEVVRPIPKWIVSTLFTNPIWLTKLGLRIAWFVIHNMFFNKNMNLRDKFKPTYRILKTAVRHEQCLQDRALSLLKKSPMINIVLFAHDHRAIYRKTESDGEYFNCGTWCNIVSLYTESLGARHQLNYVLMRKKDEERNWKAQLRRWYGTPVIDELVGPR